MQRLEVSGAVRHIYRVYIYVIKRLKVNAVGTRLVVNNSKHVMQ
jgi:hypothetical protein